VALKLPLSIMTKPDLHRLIREMEALDNYIHQNSIRGQKSAALPRLTSSLEALLRDNKMDVMDDKARNDLRKILADLLTTAPVVHMSFAIEPSSFMTQKIVSWFRTEVHPALMLHTGIQPTIAAGCVLRTSNKFFDFSLRQHLRSSQDLLRQSIQSHTEEVSAPQVSVTAVAETPGPTTAPSVAVPSATTAPATSIVTKVVAS
jgi:F0F1-type ATP synthase delta subunit